MSAAVEVAAVTKRFGTRAALDDVSLSIAPGELFGLVGRNGSGKSTLLKLLAGLLAPSEGRVRLLGHEPFRAREAVMRDARFAFAPPALFETLTARETVRHLARLGGRAVAPREVDEALAAVGLVERADDRVRTYSFGMRQRLALAIALVPRPRLLVLDEPTEGLDPQAVLALRALLLALCRDHGVTIVLASHLLGEVESLVDRLALLQEGRLLFCGAIDELRAGSERLRIVVAPRDGGAGAASAASAAAAALRAAGIAATLRGDTLELPAGSCTLEQARALLQAARLELLEFHVERPPLEALLDRRVAQAKAASHGAANGATR
ncbi:MAG: ABC transporter ATP-binding protein [Planctomycetes bacterium]|nr:ABC transporter ATP-binding protein [Planctomycetota bacterium]